MKLLIVTQKVDQDDPILGFFHDWIIEFARNCQQVIVICLEKGKVALPDNVTVLSLGKETKISRLSYIVNFYRYIYSRKNDYDAVFVHMNQIYIILGFWLWKFLNKKTALWYTHKAVTPSLRAATSLVDMIFTASPESFRLQNKKVHVVGHGINTDKLIPQLEPSNSKKHDFSIVTIGRISKSKNIDVLIAAVQKLVNSGLCIKLFIVGGPVTAADQKYEAEIKNKFNNQQDKSIVWVGAVPHQQIIDYIQGADIFIHASDTGSLDKVILEAMACEKIVISSNDAAKNILFTIDNNLIFRKKDSYDLANKIEYFYYQHNNANLGKELRDIVVKRHNLSSLVINILKIIS